MLLIRTNFKKKAEMSVTKTKQQIDITIIKMLLSTLWVIEDKIQMKTIAPIEAMAIIIISTNHNLSYSSF
jgi:hypothetical protein